MRKLLLLAAAGMAAFMDFGMGALIAALMARWYRIDVPWWDIGIGGVLALVPDADTILPMARGQHAHISGHHSSPLHWPVLMFPLVGTAAAAVSYWWWGDYFWLMVALSCLLWHYIHDTPAFFGGDFNWLAPIGKNPHEAGREDYLVWVERTWLRPSYRGVFELVVGSGALSVALSTSGHDNLRTSAGFLVILGILTVWFLASRLRK